MTAGAIMAGTLIGLAERRSRLHLRPAEQPIARHVLVTLPGAVLVRTDVVTSDVPRRLEHRYLWEILPCK